MVGGGRVSGDEAYMEVWQVKGTFIGGKVIEDRIFDATKEPGVLVGILKEGVTLPKNYMIIATWGVV